MREGSHRVQEGNRTVVETPSQAALLMLNLSCLSLGLRACAQGD